jgi:hypothetical protein
MGKNTLKKTMQDVIKMKREVREIQQIPHEELNTLLASFILTIGKKMEANMSHLLSVA